MDGRISTRVNKVAPASQCAEHPVNRRCLSPTRLARLRTHRGRSWQPSGGVSVGATSQSSEVKGGTDRWEQRRPCESSAVGAGLEGQGDRLPHALAFGDPRRIDGATMALSPRPTPIQCVDSYVLDIAIVDPSAHYEVCPNLKNL